ncbi:hypothetical protein HDU97_006091 [Phlyctochytrium planicorne]|nr:hypothetical protein HDU97_006091 [Phlyctochytrium planicorne]
MSSSSPQRNGNRNSITGSNSSSFTSLSKKASQQLGTNSGKEESSPSAGGKRVSIVSEKPPELPLYLPQSESIMVDNLSSRTGSSRGKPDVIVTIPTQEDLLVSHTSDPTSTPPQKPASLGSKKSAFSLNLSPGARANLEQQQQNYPLSPLAGRINEESLSPSQTAPPTGGASSPLSASATRIGTLFRNVRSATLVVNTMKDLTQTDAPKIAVQKTSNTAKSTLSHTFKWKGSILPLVIVPTLVSTAWTTMWVVIYFQAKWTVFATNPLLISIIGVVLSLLLVFRNNTAYDRYWEGRRMWAAISTHCRNLFRVVWVITIGLPAKQIMSTSEGDAKIEQDKRGALNLVLAFPIATKHMLRGQYGIKYTDLMPLVAHIPAFASAKSATGPEELDRSCHKVHFNPYNVPLEILYHLTSYMYRARKAETYDLQGQSAFMTALTGLADSLTSLERIRNSPIPLVYNIHLKAVVIIYLMSLPFQLVGALNWFAIPVVCIASFIFLGIECIALQIENPFGEDANDLPMEHFIEQIRSELQETVESDGKRDPSLWFIPQSMSSPLMKDNASSRRSTRASYHGSVNSISAVPPLPLPPIEEKDKKA